MTANTANQFSGVSKSGVFSIGYSYDAFGRVNQIKRGTTAQLVLGFDGFDRLTSLANTFASAPSNINYGLAYTPAHQLKSLTASNASYDWPVSATNQARVADGLNRDAGIAALQGGYDLRGNLTKDGTRQYGYDTENHLISVTGPVKAGNSKRWSPKLDLVMRCFNLCVGDGNHVEVPAVNGVLKGTKGVTREVLRQRMTAEGYTAGTENPENIRRAMNRTIDQLIEHKRLRANEHYVWVLYD
jgi:hypothetical protein